MTTDTGSAQKHTERLRCPSCGGLIFAVVDERKPDGRFGPGPDRRCVECKTVVPAALTKALGGGNG